MACTGSRESGNGTFSTRDNGDVLEMTVQDKIEEEHPIENISDIEFNVDEFKTPFSFKKFFLLAFISLIAFFAIEVYFAYNRMFPDVQETILESTENFISFSFSDFIIIPTISVFLVCCIAMVCMSHGYFSAKTQEHLNQFAEQIKTNNEINKKNVLIATKRSVKFREVVAEKDKQIEDLTKLVEAQNVVLTRSSESPSETQKRVEEYLAQTADKTERTIATLQARALAISREYTQKTNLFLQNLSDSTTCKAVNAKLSNDLEQEILKNQRLQEELDTVKSRKTDVEASQAAGLAALRKLLRATEQAAERLGIPKDKLRRVRKALMAQTQTDRSKC